MSPAPRTDKVRERALAVLHSVERGGFADPLLDAQAVRFPEITPAGLTGVLAGLGGSHGVDVTGGMVAKVGHALELVARFPGLEVLVCSGLQPDHIRAALLGGRLEFGTVIHA